MPENEPSKPWAKITSHQDLKPNRAYYVAMAVSSLLGVASLGFCVVENLNGAEVPLPVILVFILSLCWIIYQLTRVKWKQYATWVFEEGRRTNTSIDLVPSGELDRPFIVVEERNAMTNLYDTRVYAIQFGEVEAIDYDPRYPKSNCRHDATAIYDQQKHGNAVIFEIGGHRLWCKAVPKKLN